ncbi:acetylesterase [Paenibacillus montaniterrae]|uniref:Acetylesterase n=1 Tax=Paenibacillus montaniterrae TaxID=429341 RepID=A0A919YP46_9BACL|nr:alpha/beta hydrolase [Paenibacillus montaniterrae]GIP14831.1 acetylesterase [Paenibacillus montaniterrae]
MHIETIQLWEEFPQVTLTAYIPYEVANQYQPYAKPALLIFPGGGYIYTSDREAEPVALRFASLGYRTFVLHYNTYHGKAPVTKEMEENPNPHVKFPQPLYDAAKAISTIRKRAAEWNIDPDQIAVAGFSAGGHLAASIGVHWNKAYLAEHLGESNEQFKPNALVLGYALIDNVLAIQMMTEQEREKFKDLFAMINKAMFGDAEADEEELKKLSPVHEVGPHTPPSFLWHTSEDDLVLTAHSLSFAMELCKHRIPHEMHIFEKGGHGLSLADATTATHADHLQPAAAKWVELAHQWLQLRFKPQA